MRLLTPPKLGCLPLFRSTNPGNQSVTVYLRYRETDTTTWTTATSITTTGTSVAFSLTGLTENTGYSIEASLASTYSSPVTADFTTTSTPEFTGTISTVSGDKCMVSTSGETIEINGASLTIHGFCRTEAWAFALHVAAGTDDSHVTAFSSVTGTWTWKEVGQSTNIYSDQKDTQGVGFAGEALAASNVLGFSTSAITTPTQSGCSEGSGNSGFDCSNAAYTALANGDSATLAFGTAEALADADQPSDPTSLSATRNSDFTEITISWTLYDAVVSYQINRLTAVLVGVGEASRIEYGNPATYNLSGTAAGVSEWTQSVDAGNTYQYRLRARGAAIDSWSDWTNYIFSGAQSTASQDIGKPTNLSLTRSIGEIEVNWTAPGGTFDSFTLQRQELVVVEGSTLFANVITISADGSDWLPGDSTTYTDGSILPDRTYEYRIAAVNEDLTGEYTEWARISPINLSLGAAPSGFSFDNESDNYLDTRREFWAVWDPVDGADDYQIQIRAHSSTTASYVTTEHIIRDSTFFHTSYGRSQIRVRARKEDSDLCGVDTNNRCYTEWTAWGNVPFVPAPLPVPTVTPIDDSSDTSIMEFRDDVDTVLEAALEPAGADVNTGLAKQFAVLVGGLVLAGTTVLLAWRRGMAPMGVGMGCAILVLTFFLGNRLLGIPLAWPVAAQTLVALLGLYALVRQLGVFR